MALPALSGNDMPARRAAPAYRRSACPYAADASMTRLQSPLSAPADLSSVKHSGVRHGPAPRLPADIKVKRRSAGHAAPWPGEAIISCPTPKGLHRVFATELRRAEKPAPASQEFSRLRMRSRIRLAFSTPPFYFDMGRQARRWAVPHAAMLDAG